MSKNFKGYMGDQIGKLGTAVGRRWKRKMVYAAYQGRVKNPRTEDQMLVRARFKQLGEMSGSFLNAIKLGLAIQAEKHDYTEVDHFIKRNWNAVTASEPDEVTVDFGALVVSEGHLTEVSFKTPSFAEEKKVTVAFDSNSDSEDAKGDDKVYLFVYQPDINRGVMTLPVSRSAGTITATVPARWSGMQVHVYGFTVGGDPSNMGNPSDSTYIGSGTIA